MPSVPPTLGDATLLLLGRRAFAMALMGLVLAGSMGSGFVALARLVLVLAMVLVLEEHFFFLLESDFFGVAVAFSLVHWLWHGLVCEPPWELWGGGCKSDGRSFDLLFFFFFFPGLHVFVQQLSHDVHFIQTLSTSTVGVIMPADNVIHV